MSALTLLLLVCLLCLCNIVFVLADNVECLNDNIALDSNENNESCEIKNKNSVVADVSKF